MKLGINLIKDIDFITCPYCKRQFQYLYWKHLKTHNKTLENVRNEFPDLPTMTKSRYEIEIEYKEKRKKAKKESDKKTKIVNCFHCKKEIEVNYNCSNEYSICKYCKEKYENPIITNDVIEKRKETFIKKYGVTNASYINEVKEKRLKTRKFNKENIEDYGGNQGEKWRKTLKEKYGEN